MPVRKLNKKSDYSKSIQIIWEEIAEASSGENVLKILLVRFDLLSCSLDSNIDSSLIAKEIKLPDLL